MGAEIYYFTGTGNSLVAAKEIVEKIDAKVISIPSVMGLGDFSTEASVIGIVFPVYMWGIPLIVERFILKLKPKKDQYLFAVATYGGMPGGTIRYLDTIIEGCGGKLSAGFAVKMPGNYTPMYGAIEKNKQQLMFEALHKKAGEIADYVNARKLGKKECNNPLVNALFTGLIYGNSAKYIPKMDKDFFTNQNCNGCAICEKICPVTNIAMIDGKPTWKGQCEQCLACLQWCPKEAIQFGKNTEKRKRYQHPEVSLSDMLAGVGKE